MCVCVCVCVCVYVWVCVCVRFCVYILIFTIKEKYRHFVQLSNIKPKLAVCLKRPAKSQIIIKGNAYLQPKVSTNFKSILETGTWEVVEKVVINLNLRKIEDQSFCFHKKFDNLPDHKIFSFKTLLYSQWQQQCFVCLRKLFVCLWVYFYFWKIKWFAGGIECLKEVHETIIMEVYIHQAKFYLFFSCRHVCPGNCSIRSHNHNFLNSYWPVAIPWHFETEICAMM